MKRFFSLLSLLLLHAFFLEAQAPVDCANRLVVCGNTNLSFNASGRGTDDFAIPGNPAPNCGVRENQSLWLSIPIASDGTLSFDIVPNSPGDDFDFAIFGPDANCSSLGSALRCSFASPRGSNGITGTRLSAEDISENSMGDGFVSPVQVLKGETYVLLIDNFRNSNQGFELRWTGNLVIATEPTLIRPAIDPVCDIGNDNLEPYNLETLDNVIANEDPDIIVSYHLTEDDAMLGHNEINKNHIISDEDVIYARGTFTDNGCASVIDISFELNSVPKDISILGPVSVCPDVTDILYQVTGDDRHQYEWSVTGGVITSDPTAQEVTVNWAGPNTEAYLEVVVTTPEGCMSEPIRLRVTVNTELSPSTPFGPTELCIAAAEEVTYSVPSSTGSEYTWAVVNGTLISPNGTHEVRVRWDADAPGEISYREFNPNIAACEGSSPVLTVTFHSGIFTVPMVTDVRCHGESTGTVDLNPTGGTGQLNVSWDDGTSGPLRTNLQAGEYIYTITDDNGCSLTGSVTITQPDELVITQLISENLNCFKDNTGFASVMITGASAPYRYQWFQNGKQLPFSGAEIENLTAGNYRVEVRDVNGCMVTEDFTLTEPELLEPDLNQLINVPICPRTSDGEVTVGAKGGYSRLRIQLAAQSSSARYYCHRTFTG